VGENGSFGGTGGSGGVDYSRRGVGQDFVLSWGQAGGLSYGDGRRGNGERGFGVGEDVSDLAVLIEDVDRHENQTQLDASQVDIDHLDGVGQVDADAIPRFETAREEQLGRVIAARVEIAKGVSCALEFERDGVAAAGEGGGEEFGKRQVAIVIRAPAPARRHVQHGQC
jgi:hypothetical protein